MSSAEILLLPLIGFPLFILATTILCNIPFYRRLKRERRSNHTPTVSILIPARNEATIIATSIKAHLASSYPHLELILLDDNSTDGTATVAREAADGDPRFTLIDGDALPDGWLGKNWACHQLANAASGDLLVFTDADVQWHTDAISAIVAEQAYTQAALLSIFPTQHTITWGERLTVPLLAHAILAYLPLVAVNLVPLRAFAAANGQCMVFQREAYQTIGGHSSVKAEIIEDIKLAQAVKANRLRLRIADGNQLVTCRMYRSYGEAIDGFGKNMLAGHLNSIPFLAVSTIFHWLVFVMPILWFLWKLWAGGDWAIPLLFALAGIGIRAASAACSQQRVRDALLMPLSVFVMTRIAWRSVRWRLQGQTTWKGRTLS